MATTIQFVDRVDAAPTVRLNLNSRAAGLMVAPEGIDFSPPPLRRATSSSMLEDGDRVTAAAHGNRVLRLPIQTVTIGTDAVASVVQQLGRELDRPSNWLKIQLDGATKPLFYETLRAPDYTWQMLRLLADTGMATLEIPARPYALGLREDVSIGTVSNNPASGGCDFSVPAANVIGDVETPALFRFTATAGVLGALVVLGRRARYTSSSIALFNQAEASGVALGPDTTTQSNDATASGSGSNYVRTTFAGTLGYVNRWRSVFPPTTEANITEEHRGVFKGLARLRRSNTTSNVEAGWALGVSGSELLLPRFTVPKTTGWRSVDLGDFSPQQLGPDTWGYSGIPLRPGGAQVSMFAGADAAVNLDFDRVLFVPADECVTILRIDTTLPPSTTTVVVDGPQNRQYVATTDVTTSTVLATSAAVRRAGRLPMLAPGRENRFMLAYSALDGADDITNSTSWTVSYWPRYLGVIRPVSS